MLYEIHFKFTILVCGLYNFCAKSYWWQLERDPWNTEWYFEVNYTFKVEGNVVTGVWKTQFGESKLEDGKIEGKKFSYSISFNENKMSSTAELINENEIMVKNERGEMKLTRIK